MLTAWGGSDRGLSAGPCASLLSYIRASSQLSEKLSIFFPKQLGSCDAFVVYLTKLVSAATNRIHLVAAFGDCHVEDLILDPLRTFAY